MRERDSAGRGDATPGKDENTFLESSDFDSDLSPCAQKQVKDLQRRLSEVEKVKQEDIKPAIHTTPEVIDLTQ